MPAARVPPHERERLASLASYQILDTPREPDFDAVTELVAQICETPFAIINLVGEGRQFFKSEVGLGVREMPLDSSICAHALLQPGLFVIPDLAADIRFVDNPMVNAGPGFRFYAGQLLKSQDGFDIGALCALDTRPRELSPMQRAALATLGRHVMSLLELRKLAERDRRRLAEQTTRNQELDGALAGHHRVSAMVAHDLRSPLGVIALGAQMLGGNPDLQLAAVGQRIVRAVASMQGLLADLLDLEQSNADALRITPARVASTTMIRAALESFAPLAEAAGVALRSATPLDIEVVADERRIHQVLANLIGNALKVSPRGGAITVDTATADATHVRIAVTDDGPGISAEDQTRVFDPYFTKPVGGAKGTGLGLTISKRIVDASGGQMGIESAPGRGATFWFTIPIAPPA